MVQKELQQVSNSAQIRKISDDQNDQKEYNNERRNSEDEFTKAINNLNRHEKFLQCCEKGGKYNIEKMGRILDSDPKKSSFFFIQFFYLFLFKIIDL